MKRKFFAAFLSLCMVMSLVPMTALAAENDESGTPSTQLPDPVDGVITLETDTTLQSTTIDEDTVLDLNGKTLTLNGEIGIVVNNNTSFTVCDSSVAQPPQVTDKYAVNYSSGKIQHNNNSNCAIQVQNGANFTLESGTIYSEKGNGVNVLAQTNPNNEEKYNSSATINGGYISAQEFGIGVYGRTAVLNVNGGVIEARDNAAVAGNGSRDADYTPEGYVINVNEGTLIGKITSDGYASCGIYHPNAGTVNVIGGEIISTKGAGIVARAGQTNISGGRITALGESNFAGKVGDSRVVVSTSGVVLDLAANYGGADIENGVATNADVYVSGEATISGTNSSIDVIEEQGSSGSEVREQDNVIITGGTFTSLTNGQSSPDSSAGKFFPAGALLTQDDTGKVIAREPVGGESAVAEVNGVSYTSLQRAIDMARDGDTVTLLQDETLNDTITVDKTVTIDLNQHTVAGNAVRAFHVTNGTMTLTGRGTVTSTTMKDSNSSVIRVGNNGTEGTTPAGLVVGENVVIEAPGTYGISVFGDATKETLTVNGTVTATGPAPAISGNGMYDGTSITIGETANISASQSVAIYHPQDGTLIINGGIITGGIEAKSGTITINGNPSISAVGEKDHAANGNGPSTTGYAIAIVDNSAYGNGATITINSGSYNGPVEYLEDGNGVGSGNKSGSITVSGGSFGESVAQYVADALNYEANANGIYTYHKTLDEALATGGEVKSIQAATTGEDDTLTVTLIDRNDTTKIEVVSGEEIPLPSRSDYGYNHFVGWKSSVDGKTYQPGDKVDISGNVTFTAQWTYIPPANPNYRIDIPDFENGTVTADPAAAKAGAKVTLTATPDEGYAVGTITVTDRFGDAVKVTENADGTYTFTMPNGQVTVTATFVETEEPVAEPFIDVAEGDWFYDAVVYAYQNELMDGVGGNRFAPNSETTRAQLVTILYRLEGEPAVSGDLPFTDVEAGIWYTDAILWAAENNIVNGVSDTEFAPGDDLTRQQLVTILYRYAEAKGYDVSASADLSGYPDAGQVQDYAQPAMAWAVAENIIQGMEDGTLKPAGNASRAQIATILMRFCEDVAQ